MTESDTESGAQASADDTPRDAAASWMLGLRDLAILLAALSLFAAADAWYAVTETGFAAVLSVLDGLLVGAAAGAVVHEWGHFAGARFSGATAPNTAIGSFFPLFNFDFSRSSVDQFQTMSIGGNVAHWMLVLVFLMFVPMQTPGVIALISGAFGFAVFASSIEFPVIRRTHDGMAPLESLGKISNLSTKAATGVAAAFVLFLVL